MYLRPFIHARGAHAHRSYLFGQHSAYCNIEPQINDTHGAARLHNTTSLSSCPSLVSNKRAAISTTWLDCIIYPTVHDTPALSYEWGFRF